MKYFIFLFVLTLFSSCSKDENIFSDAQLIESKFYKLSGSLDPSKNNLTDVYSVYFDQKANYQIFLESFTNSHFNIELIRVKTGEKRFLGSGFRYQGGGSGKNQFENDEYHLKITSLKESVDYAGSISGLVVQPRKL